MNRQKCILVTEDNQSDFLLLRRCFEKAGLTHKLVHAGNGKEAWDYLVGEPPFSDRNQHPFPDLLLLDLRMPGLDGFDLLRLLQSHRELSALPVVILSASLVESYMQTAKRLGAREYLLKPMDPNEYTHMVLGLQERWLEDIVPGVPSA